MERLPAWWENAGRHLADFAVAVALLLLARGLGVAPAPQPLRCATRRFRCRRWVGGARRAPQLLQAEETQVDEPLLDPRGFVVPQIGDVVKVPSKWQGEYDLAQVDFVQFIESRQATTSTCASSRRSAAVSRRPAGSRPPAERVDVAKLGRIDAEFVSDRDAYLVDESELRFTAPKTDVDALAEAPPSIKSWRGC